MRAVVIGGGLAGVAAAVSLEGAGLDVLLCEAAPELASVGSGLFLPSNGIAALERLGAGEQVARSGTVVERQLFLTAGGRRLGGWEMAPIVREVGAPTVGARRPEVHRALRANLDRTRVETNRRLVSYAQDADAVTAQFADGTSESADVLVGADGIRSTVRAQMLGPSEPRFAGYTGWRALVGGVEGLVPVGDFRMYWGAGTRIVMYHVGDGQLYWLVLSRNPPGGTDPPSGARGEILRRLARFPAQVLDVVAATVETDIKRVDIADRDPTDRWTDDRVALLGDAAHAMTPNLGQGACQGFEDAVVLASSLARSPDVPAGLRDYERARRERAAGFARRSRLIGRLGRWQRAPARAVRYAVLRVAFGVIAPGQQTKDLAAPF